MRDQSVQATAPPLSCPVRQVTSSKTPDVAFMVLSPDGHTNMAPILLGRLLTAGAVLETPVGLGLLLTPSSLAEILLGAPLSEPGLAVARIGGGGLLALGIACWFARGTPSTAAGLGVARAFLAYNLVACGVLFAAYPPLPGGAAALGAAILHGILAGMLLIALFGSGRAQTGL